MMKRTKLPTVVFGLMLLLFFAWYIGSGEHQARAAGPSAIPKAWGTCKGSIAGDLIFEDSAGTIRLVSVTKNGELTETNRLDFTYQRN